MIGDADAVGLLIAALKDNSCPVRRSAAWALGEIGDKKAVEPLKKALEIETYKVPKEAMLEALRKLEKPEEN